LVPYWAKDASVGYKMINARAETAAEKQIAKLANIEYQLLAIDCEELALVYAS
jgi:hypothetical protein